MKKVDGRSFNADELIKKAITQMVVAPGVMFHAHRTLSPVGCDIVCTDVRGEGNTFHVPKQQVHAVYSAWGTRIHYLLIQVLRPNEENMCWLLTPFFGIRSYLLPGDAFVPTDGVA